MEKRKLDMIYYLYNYYEINNGYQNGEIFKSVIDAISKKLGVPIVLNFMDPNIEDYVKDIAAGISLVEHLVFEEAYQEFVLALLGNKHFYMKSFIKSLIKEIGNAKDRFEAEIIIDKYLKLPIINNVKFNGIDEYCVQTAYGDYPFLLADQVLNDQDLIEYMQAEDRRDICHYNATTLVNNYDDLYTICSLCHRYFIGGYYHSYGFIEQKDCVLDICSKMLMKKRVFDDLYGTREILFMRNDKLKQLYFDKVKGIESKLEDESVLKCALYMQSLSLNKNPEEKRRVLEFNGVTNLQ